MGATYALPKPPQGRIWIAADAPFDPTIHRGPWRPTISWPASDFGGRSAAVIEAMKHHVAPATWMSIAGAELGTRGGYAIFARTTLAVHVKIRQWLNALHWTRVATRQSADPELAWMLTHGTPLEREWAHEALAWVTATSRDRIEDSLVNTRPPSDAEAPKPDDVDVTAKPRVRLACRLIRSDSSFFRDVGISVPELDSRYFKPEADNHMALLDGTQWDVLERCAEKRGRVVQLASADTVSPTGSRVQYHLGQQAVLHLRMTVSRDRRFIGMQGRVHAQDGSALFFVPHFTISVPDGGMLLICVRDVITGQPSSKHTLSLLLRAECIDFGAHSPPEPDLDVPDLPDTVWVPVPPVRERKRTFSTPG